MAELVVLRPMVGVEPEELEVRGAPVATLERSQYLRQVILL